VRRRSATAKLSEKEIVSRLALLDADVAARALRRHRAWREAVSRHAGVKEQRALRRAWERARDEAMMALGIAEMAASTGARDPRAATNANAATRGNPIAHA